jgi:hypothetical protein
MDELRFDPAERREFMACVDGSSLARIAAWSERPPE